MSASLSYASPLSSKPVSHDLPADYYVQFRHGSFGAYLDGYGLIEDGYDCEADAIFRCQEHAEACAEERRDADENAAEAAADGDARLADAVAVFLQALDLGHFGKTALRFGNGAESAYVTSMRQRLAAVRQVA